MPIQSQASTASPELPLVTAVLDDLRRIVRTLRESSRDAQRLLGVSGAQLFVLKALSGTTELSLNDLAARTRTHQSTVSGVVKRLVERGLIRRRTSDQDGRRLSLELTKRGQALLQRAPRAAQDRLIEGLERLSLPERRVLATALHSLVLAMQLGDEAPAMFFEEEDSSAQAPSRAQAKPTRKPRVQA